MLRPFTPRSTMEAHLVKDATVLSKRWLLTMCVGLLVSTSAAVAAEAGLLAANSLPGRVSRYSANTGALLGVVVNDPNVGTIGGMAIGPDGLLYVASDSNRSVRRYDRTTGALVGVFVTSSAGHLASIVDIAFGPTGDLFVADADNHRIVVFSGRTGAYSYDLTNEGTSRVRTPRALHFDGNDRLLVTSFDTNSVVAIDLTQRTEHQLVSSSSGGLQNPVGLVVGADNDLYVASHALNRILRYNAKTGAFRDIFAATTSNPAMLRFGPSADLFVGTASHEVVQVNHITGTVAGQFTTGQSLGDVRYLTFENDLTIISKPDTNHSQARVNRYLDVYDYGRRTGSAAPFLRAKHWFWRINSGPWQEIGPRSAINSHFSNTLPTSAASQALLPTTYPNNSGYGVYTILHSRANPGVKLGYGARIHWALLQNHHLFEAMRLTNISQSDVHVDLVGYVDGGAGYRGADVQEIELVNLADPLRLGALNYEGFTFATRQANPGIEDTFFAQYPYTRWQIGEASDLLRHLRTPAFTRLTNKRSTTNLAQLQKQVLKDGAAAFEHSVLVPARNHLNLGFPGVEASALRIAFPDTGVNRTTLDTSLVLVNHAPQPARVTKIARQGSRRIQAQKILIFNRSGTLTNTIGGPTFAFTLPSFSYAKVHVAFEPSTVGSFTTALEVSSHTVIDDTNTTAYLPEKLRITLLGRGINEAPVASDDRAVTTEDTAVTINVLRNDSDPNGDPLTIASVGTPANGTASVVSGDVLYTPKANFAGTDRFTYAVRDRGGLRDSATVMVEVRAVDDPPRAQTDRVRTPEDTPLDVDVLANDIDPEGLPLVLVSASANSTTRGTVSLTSTNKVRFVPAADFFGTDRFDYTMRDAGGQSATASVIVTVLPINDAPRPVDDIIRTDEDTAATLDLFANDVEVEGDALAFVSMSQPAHGQVQTGSGGSVTYTPASNYHGPDAFSYTVQDPSGAQAQADVRIEVRPRSDAPIAANDSAVTNEDTSVVIDVLANDTDADGDTLSVSNHSTPQHGTVAPSVGGTLTYTPAANYNGSDSFTYEVSDGHGGTDTATVNVTVRSVNDTPIANNDTETTLEDAAVVIDVLANDTDADGDNILISAITQPAHGAVVEVNGKLRYTPTANYAGTDTFSYTIEDPAHAQATASVRVTVSPVNDLPTANPDTLTTAEDSAATIDVIANDTDPEGATLRLALIGTAAHGQVTPAGGNSLTYTPASNFNGTDQFTYAVEDPAGGQATGIVQVVVQAVNDTPTPGTDSVVTTEDTSIAIDVLANDVDIDGDALSIVSWTDASHGTVAQIAGPALHYTPATNFSGTDTFTYRVEDPSGAFADALVSIRISPTNDTPLALDDAATVHEDSQVVIDVLANDTDADGDILQIASVGTGSHGVATIDNGQLLYIPNANANGTDRVGYTTDDSNGGVSSAEVEITIVAINDAPAVDAGPDVTTPEGDLVTLQAIVDDVDGDVLTLLWVQTAGQTVVISGATTDTLSFTAPTLAINGTETFTFELTVDDGRGGVVSDQVTVSVTNVNQAPQASAAQVQTPVDIAVDIQLAGTDGDSDPLTFVLVQTPANGTLENFDPATGRVTYRPDSGFSGADSFSFMVADALTQSNEASVQVDVYAPASVAPAAVGIGGSSGRGLTGGGSNGLGCAVQPSSSPRGLLGLGLFAMALVLIRMRVRQSVV